MRPENPLKVKRKISLTARNLHFGMWHGHDSSVYLRNHLASAFNLERHRIVQK